MLPKAFWEIFTPRGVRQERRGKREILPSLPSSFEVSRVSTYTFVKANYPGPCNELSGDTDRAKFKFGKKKNNVDDQKCFVFFPQVCH